MMEVLTPVPGVGGKPHPGCAAVIAPCQDMKKARVTGDFSHEGPHLCDATQLPTIGAMD